MSTPSTLTLHPQGMSCSHCIGAVREALECVPGVVVEAVSLGEARVSGEAVETQRQALAQALDEAGYPLADESAGHAR